MAERRMFAKTIIDSDAFLDMPASTQLLYFHLSMRADDDGFINKPKTIMRICGAKDDDAKLLVTKKFIIPFDTGIVVIKHWKIHNYIAKDRYTETKYKEEKESLGYDNNGAYTTRIQDVDGLETQVRLGKDRLGEDIDIPDEEASKDKEPKPKKAKPDKKPYGEFQNVYLTDAEYNKYLQELGKPALDACIEQLSAWCESKDKIYKGAAGALRSWVIGKMQKERPELFRKSPSTPTKELDADILAVVQRANGGNK